MSHFAEYHQDWIPFDGVKVRYQGLTYRIDVRMWNAIYPTKRRLISVYATPVSRRSKKYQEVRQQLGDDWSTCLLDSDVSVEAEFFNLAKKSLATAV